MPVSSELASDSYVATDAFRRLYELIETNTTPIFVVGLAGTGKSAAVQAVARKAAAAGRHVFTCRLATISREADIVAQLRLSSPSKDASFAVRSSSDSVITSAVDILREFRVPLILLDGFDETLNQHAVARFVDEVSRETDSVIVVTGRIFDRHLFRTRFVQQITLTLFEPSEFETLIDHFAGALEIDRKIIDRVYEISQGSPLLAKLIVESLKHYGTSSLDFEPSGKNLIASIEGFIERDVSRLGLGDSKGIYQFLFLLLLRESIPLSEVTSLQIPHAQKILGSSLVVVGNEEVRFAHSMIASAFLSLSQIEPPTDLSLQDLYFGAEEAERDPLLHRMFVRLPGMPSFRRGKIGIVVGDRGAGKSALFAQLSSSQVNELDHCIVLPVRQPADQLRKLESNGSELCTAEQFKAGWLTLTAYALAQDERSLSSAGQKRTAHQLREILEDTSGYSWTLRKVIRRIFRSSIKIKLGPVMIEPATALDKGKGAGAIVDLLAFIREAASSLVQSKRSAIVIFDRIDEIHKYDRSLQQKAIQGLFLAEAAIAQLSGISLLIFIRSDLFNLYDIQEKNKLITRTLTLNWSQVELFKFLVDRVLSNDCLSRLRQLVDDLPGNHVELAMNAIFPRQVEGVAIQEWLWSSIRNGNGRVSPRQLVLLLVLAIQAPSVQGAGIKVLPILPAEALRWAMDELSEFSFTELIDDFRVARVFLGNCRAGKIETFKLEEVSALFGADDGPISLQIHQLERLGFLERVVIENQSSGAQSSEFRVPPIFTRCWFAA